MGMCSIILYQPLILLIFIQCGTSLTRVTQQSSPHVWVSASLWASRPLYGPWTSPTHSPLPNGLFTSSMHHPRFSPTPSMGTTCQPRTHIHGNPARLCPWEPRTTPLFRTISNIPLLGFSFLSFFSRIFVCGPFRLSLSPLGRDHEHITTFAAQNLALIPLVREINTLGSFLE